MWSGILYNTFSLTVRARLSELWLREILGWCREFSFSWYLQHPVGRLPLNPVALKGETILFFHCSSSQNTYLKLMQPLQRTVWRLLKKLKLELSYDPAIPLLGIYLEKKKTLTQRDTCTPIFIAALFIVLKTWKPLKCPSADEWIKKMWYI